MVRTLLATGLLVCCATIVSVQETSGDAAPQEALSQEAIAWAGVKDSASSADVFAFIEQYPNGEFTADAQALMIDLLFAEMNTAPVEEDVVVVEDAEEPTSLDTILVTFSTPLTQGDPEVVGRSIEELIDGSPLFPPVEGLPASYWETQECSNCHEWEQANLCDQANTYLTDAGAENLDKPHPYGGTFKENLVIWATGGCQ